jgi:hypothetical protein
VFEGFDSRFVDLMNHHILTSHSLQKGLNSHRVNESDIRNQLIAQGTFREDSDITIPKPDKHSIKSARILLDLNKLRCANFCLPTLLGHLEHHAF